MNAVAERVEGVSCRGLMKVYGTGGAQVTALRGVDLDVATSGTDLLAGEDVSNLSENDLAVIRNERIGFVFQQFNLLPSLTAWRNVELPLCYAGVPRGPRKARAIDVLDRVGLSDRVQHKPSELSGGQQSRVALARALVNSPAMILADEPTGALDTTATADVLGVFADLNEAGNSIVLITHEEDVAATAKRTIRLRDGLIESDTVNKKDRLTGVLS